MKNYTSFYADDGIILRKELQFFIKSIKTLKQESLKFGLEINQSKNKKLIFIESIETIISFHNNISLKQIKQKIGIKKYK